MTEAEHRQLLAEVPAEVEAARFRLLADNVPVLIALYEINSFRCLYANKAYAQTFGYDVHSIIGLSFAQVIGEAATAEIQPHVDHIIQVRQPVQYERQLRAADGRARWLDVNLIPQLAPDGEVIGAFVLIADISERRAAEQALRESEARLDTFMQATLEGLVFHREGIVSDVNPALCQLVDYRADELIGRRALDFVAPQEVAKVAAMMQAGHETRYETVLLHRDGSQIPVEFIVRSMIRHGERLRMAVVRDLRSQVEAQARIHYLAHHDALTQLLNRSAFMERLERALAPERQPPQQHALLFIDLDNFKRVNDSLGHLEGDKVLSTVAERLSACLRSSDLVGRFGGDEFVVLLSDVPTRADVVRVLSALLSVVEVPVQADGRDLSVTPSIGVALFPAHGLSAKELIQHADLAMYRAKASGRATYEFFEPGMAEKAYADLVLEAELVQALTRDEFQLFYQPQVDARSGALVGAEALLRWQHPERGLLSPDAFIAVAERHRLMLALGEWVLREAARQSRLWHENGLAPVPIAVNLSSMQFRLDSFDGLMARVLAEGQLPGAWLELELTERMLMDDISAVPELLHALRAQGLSISVDDFGTGYTSLAHLTQLPLDKLKIDQSFVAALPGDRGALAVTRAIVQMAQGLGLKVSAEGVRNEAQRELLASWGCDGLQGELIGPPMPAAQFESWLAARR
ncbi:EAL domain-containing protein [Paucibacter sp. APW11]|uniref:EAL domain-containing protein n=1 Tax=Roseateles aquae TaxID=3077235 RepID=A0ABU3PAP2_9BURK|nr:EAL domain-containing protein [Paucibacter sp. APW11]MDT8999649.1 EAL domain-containing protein [Paucibacter sp. APW11]